MTKVGITEKEQSILSSIKYSVKFGIGLTHMFSFLLNKNELQTINLTPNIDIGIKNLGEIIHLNEYKAPISVLLIFVKYIYFNKCKRALKVCQSIREHFPNSIIFTYLFNTALANQHADTKSLFTCDPEKFIRFLGPFFNKKIVNPFVNQKWEDTINNLKDYNNLVESKNLKILKKNNFYEHIYIVDKYIKFDTKSLIHENKLCIYCLFQPFVIPITKIEQSIYKWCCLKMLLFDYKKDLLIMKDKHKKEKEKEKGKEKEKEKENEQSQPPDNQQQQHPIDNDHKNIENDNQTSEKINDDTLPKNSTTNQPENHSSTNSIDSEDSIESNPTYKLKKEKYKKLKEELKIFNEFFISQCKEYKKSKEVPNDENSMIQNDFPCSICCQLDPIFLYIATNIDNKSIHSNNKTSPLLSESSSLIDIVCLLFAIHYASPSKMTDLLVKVKYINI
ncbi:hypothetical protein PIROE2DRAFT_13610 [Piromyces sp. E2]|nr:hypothetical protein PIROE2DRAFT_13610 [Piromyces sp. E2]|eukprot:OUM60591.1 hypothetical protein PIROE2DRAFT_13610 [Piromyces sp. E2]